jgi:ribosomal protein S18 acetylase RimI-like enzyme
MSDYQIRQAMPSDLDGVYAVFKLADKLHRDAHPEVFREPENPNDVKDYLLSAIRDAETVVFIAEVQDEIAGAVLAGVRHSPEISLLVQQTYLSVENLVVAEKYRGQGIGKALIAQVHHWAQALEIKYIQLTVWDFNQGAIAFYEKLGYQMLHHRMRKELP